MLHRRRRGDDREMLRAEIDDGRGRHRRASTSELQAAPAAQGPQRRQATSSSRSAAPRAARRPTSSPATCSRCTGLRRPAWAGSSRCWAPSRPTWAASTRSRSGWSGDGVWSRLKHEGGPHRVQRVPVTESQGRIHTSSATVTVLPEAEEVDVEIDPNDLQIDVYRSSGPGGQSVNTTDSAVRITHKPTGARRGHAGREEPAPEPGQGPAGAAVPAAQGRAGRARPAEASGARRGQVGGGGRSEKIRTYNFKENRVTDHRIGLTLYKLDKVLAGELDEVVDALVADERRRQLGDDADGDADRPADGAVSWRTLAARGRAPAGARPASTTAGRSEARWIVERACGLRGRRATCSASTSAATERGRGTSSTPWSSGGSAGEPLQYVLGRWALPHARPARRPPGADPPARDRGGGRRRPRRARPAPRPTARPRSWWPTSAPARGPSACRWPPSGDRTEVWVTDASADALAVARANLAGLGRPAARVRVAEGVVVRRRCPPTLRGRVDVVVSNPPYVADRRRAAGRRWPTGSRPTRCSPAPTGSTTSGARGRGAAVAGPGRRAGGRAGAAPGRRRRRLALGRRLRGRRGAPGPRRPRPRRRGPPPGPTPGRSPA